MLLIFVLLSSLFNAAPAQAETAQFFPPANAPECSREAPFLSWLGGMNPVNCMDGQTVLGLALPDCSDGQTLVFESSSRAPVGIAGSMPGRFVCTNVGTGLEVPTCAAGQVVTGGADGKLACVAIPSSSPTPTTGTSPASTASATTCGHDQYMYGLSASGTALCRSVKTPELDCVRRATPWQSLTNHQSYTVVCPAKYKLVDCYAHYYDTNGLPYHGFASASRGQDDKSCSFTVFDEGISEGSVVAACCTIFD